MSWWSQSYSSDLLPWENVFVCLSLHSAVALDYLQRNSDHRWESWEHRRTNLLLSLVRDKNKKKKNNDLPVTLSLHTKTFSRWLLCIYVCACVAKWGVQSDETWLLPNDVMLIVSHDSKMRDERWSAMFRGLLGVSWGVSFDWGRKKS